MIERQETEVKRLVKTHAYEMESLKQRIALHRSGRHSPGYLRKKAIEDRKLEHAKKGINLRKKRLKSPPGERLHTIPDNVLENQTIHVSKVLEPEDAEVENGLNQS